MTWWEFEVLLSLHFSVLGDGLPLDGNIMKMGENGRIRGDLLATTLDPNLLLTEASETLLPMRRLSRICHRAIQPTAALQF